MGPATMSHITSLLNNRVLYGNTFYKTLYDKVANYLEAHFRCSLFIKLGKLLLPDATIVHVNILAPPVDDVPNAHGLTATLNRHDFLRVEIRKLTDAEIELISEIPRSARFYNAKIHTIPR